MRRALKDAAWELACLAGLDRRARAASAGRLLIACYHGVDDGPRAGRSWLLLHARELRRQLEHLGRHFQVLPIDEALARLWAGTLRRPTACITFDDGYRNNATHAHPILEALGLPATIYLATGLIGTERRLWTTRLELAFEQSPVRRLSLDEYGLGEVAPGPTPAAFRAARAVAAQLKRLSPAERQPRLEGLLAALERDGTDDDGAFAMMDWDEARALADRGLVTFGGHTVDHEIVSRLDDAALARQVGGSIADVAAAFAGPRAGAISRTFCYPNGGPADFDGRAGAQVRAAGGTAALSTLPGLNARGTDRWALRRLVVGADMTLGDFRARASGLHEALVARVSRAAAPSAPAPA